MAESGAGVDHKQYNAVAVQFAKELNALRQAAVATPPAPRTLDQSFPAFNRAGYAVAAEYERMGEQPVTDELKARAQALGIEFEHLGLTLGTVLHNVHLQSTPTPDLVQLIRDTLLERGVVFFRDQHLSEDQQVEFARQFGELDAFPFGKAGDNPYVLEIIHDAQRPGAENGWHTDVTWMEQPSLGSIAQCVEVPPFGGDTLFSDSYVALLGLAPKLRERIEHLHGINDYRIFLPTQGPGALPQSMIDTLQAQLPYGVDHPLVRTHPETGRQVLYIHGGFLRHDSLFDGRTGEPVGSPESERIVVQLLAQHARPEGVCRFRWTPGSVAFWDNRAVQHYAASDYYPHRRVLRRVTVSGDRPFHTSQ